MGIGKSKDIWIVIYEKGIKDAQKTQKQALKMSMEGKLTGATVATNATSSAQSSLQPPTNAPGPVGGGGGAVPGGGGGGGGVAVGGGGGGPVTSASGVALSGTNSSANSSGLNMAAVAWAATPPVPTNTERFSAISGYVDTEWTLKDRDEMKGFAGKLWKKYHVAKKDDYLQMEELCELTKDSLNTLQSHISLFINNSFEEMKKTTQAFMIKMLQNHQFSKGPQSLAASSTLRAESGLAINSSLTNPTMNLFDIEWLNEEIEKEKKQLMTVLNVQIEEWIEHYVDVAEAIFRKMDKDGNGKIDKKTFTDLYGMAIYEVVGPEFFTQHLPSNQFASPEEAAERGISNDNLIGAFAAAAPPSASAMPAASTVSFVSPHSDAQLSPPYPPRSTTPTTAGNAVVAANANTPQNLVAVAEKALTQRKPSAISATKS